MRSIFTLFICGLLSVPGAAHAQSEDTASAAFAGIMERYRTRTNITYQVADGVELKLDAIVPQDTTKPVPTLLYIHGGGWVGGSKELAYLTALPYLDNGFAVVTPNYRLTRDALAPAAVEDVRCALRWIHSNAESFGFDPDRVVISGSSAGGHLALMAGLTNNRDGFDTRCPQAFRGNLARDQELPVRAIVNWFGPSDLVDAIAGAGARSFAIMWIGGDPGAEQRAARVSPLTYVKPDVPPVLSIHGDNDDVVPVDHAIKLHHALDEHDIANQLITIEGGDHGKFSKDEYLMIFAAIDEFLAQHVPGLSSEPTHTD